MEFPKDAVERVVKVRLGSEPPLGPEHAAANLRDRVMLARAAEMARSGHYDAAWSLVEEIPRESPLRAEVLDLRARILAQQGRYAEAERCWAQALRLSPGNRDYVRALDALAQERRHPVWVRPAIAAALAVLVLAAIAGIAGISGSWMGGRYDALAEQVEALQDDARGRHDATVRMLKTMQERLDSIESRLSRPFEQPGAVGKPVGHANGVGIGALTGATNGNHEFQHLFHGDVVRPGPGSLVGGRDRPG